MLRQWYNYFFSPKKELVKIIYNITGSLPVNIKLYELALTHASARISGSFGKKIDNERLEFLGDAILGAVVADLLFKKFPNRDEGFMTEMRSRIVNTNQLDNFAKLLNIDRLLQIDSKNQANLTKNKAIYADAFEAFIGAFYLDHGFQKTYNLLHKRIIAQYVNFELLLNTEHNFKSRIVEWGQKNGKKVVFDLLETVGEGHRKQFRIGIYVDEVLAVSALDFTKKGAEQLAAEKLFEQLKIIPTANH